MDTETLRLFSSREWCVSGDMAYLVSSDLTGLFSFDFRTNECKCLTSFDGRRDVAWQQYSVCKKLGNYIVCFPALGEYIYFYDCFSGNIEWYSVNVQGNNVHKIWDVYEYDNTLYAVDYLSTSIIRIRTKKNIGLMVLTMKADERVKLFGNSTRVDDYIYILTGDSSHMVKFSLVDESFTVCTIDNMNSNLIGIMSYGENILLTDNSPNLFFLNRNDNHIITKPMPKFFVKNSYATRKGISSICDMYYLADKILILPQCGNYLYIYDEINGIKIVGVPEKIDDYNKPFVFLCFLDGRYAWFYSKYSCTVWIMDFDSLTVRPHNIIVNKNVMMCMKNRLINESTWCQSVFLSMIKNGYFSCGSVIGGNFVGNDILREVV